MNAESIKEFNSRHLSLFVWICRIVVGALFIVSGLSKAIDPWGFVYKIEEYLAVWDWQQPRSIVFMGALALSGAEFVLGVMLAMGNYKRSCVWLLLAMMAGLLPLSFYIYVAHPVADCGCFGDFWKISNGATFLKNLVLTALLIYLAVYNRRVKGIYGAYIQWITGLLCTVYVLIVALLGYNVQPLIDFRSYPVGSQLTGNEDGDAVVYEFIYEKDGQRRTFGETELPDSSWTFVDRKVVAGSESAESDFAIFEDGENVTEEVIATEGEELLMLIPEYRRADVAYTYVLNELYTYITGRGGTMVGVIAADGDNLEEWRDLSMASYPLYTAESTQIKELARGVMSLVYLVDGQIEWKRTMLSVDLDMVNRHGLGSLYIDGKMSLAYLTGVLLLLLFVIWSLDRSGRLIKWMITMKKHTRRKNNAENNA